MHNVQLSFEAGDGQLTARRFHIEEKMNGLFAVAVRAMSPDESIDLSRMVGFRAELLLHGPQKRRWRGLCASMEMVRTPGSDESMTTYDLTIVPTMWRLTQRRNNRLFQHVSIPDIVDRILGEHGVLRSFRIDKQAYPKLELRTQYDETDFAFVSRLLEEAGISFYFSDEGDSDGTVVLDDAPHRGERREPLIPFVEETPQALAGGIEHVTKVALREESRPGRVTLRDHDPRRPRLPLYAGAASDRAAEAGHEQYRHLPGSFNREEGGPRPPGAAASLSAAASAALGGTSTIGLATQALAVMAGETPVADDLGVARQAAAFGTALAQRMIESMHADRRLVTFETSAHDLSPGVVFAMMGHPRSDLGVDQRLLVIRSSMEGEVASPEKWTFKGAAVFAERPYRPPFATPRPRIHGVQSAVVVGPDDPRLGDAVGIAASAGAPVANLPGATGAVASAALDAAATIARLVDNDIYVDELGRVRVQFPWDREGGYDSHSSIWMRVSQGWAGGGYGLFTIPRVGHEVLVAFLDGDPDSPIIVGRVHNLMEPVPFKLPENKTVSTWKTATSPGGGGFNELRFDDAAGREHVFLQAQKDMDHLVKNDLKQAVGHDRSRSVQNDEAIAVGHDRVKVVNHNEIDATGLNHARVVGLSRAATIGVEDSTHVGTRWSVTIARGLTSRLAREVDQITGGRLGGVLRSAATTVLGLIPNTPLASAAESTLAGLGGAAVASLKNVLSVLDGFETDPGPPPTQIEMVDRQIKLSTGEASIILDGPNVTITAQGSITLHAMKSITTLGEEEVAVAAREKVAVISATDDVIVQAKGNVHLNPYDAKTKLPPADVLDGSLPRAVPRCDVCGEALVAGEGGLVCPKGDALKYGDGDQQA
jgi:type VI secretion system secreted protein VgrG